jgi:hypothetical protein
MQQPSYGFSGQALRWGWGPPNAWQGWVVFVAFFVMLIGGAGRFSSRSTHRRLLGVVCPSRGSPSWPSVSSRASHRLGVGTSEAGAQPLHRADVLWSAAPACGRRSCRTSGPTEFCQHHRVVMPQNIQRKLPLPSGQVRSRPRSHSALVSLQLFDLPPKPLLPAVATPAALPSLVGEAELTRYGFNTPQEFSLLL